jgi:capsular exopolysaccharide synthesis family protein
MSTIPPIGPTTGALPAPASGKLKAIDPMRVLRQYAWLLVTTAVIATLIGVGLYLVLRMEAPRYTSTAAAALQSRMGNPMSATDGGIQNADEVERFLANQQALLQSEAILLAAIRRDESDRQMNGDQVLSDSRTQWVRQFNGDHAAALESLQDDVLSVGVPRGSALLRLQASTSESDDAPKILNHVLAIYRQWLEGQRQDSDRSLRSAFTNELTDAQDQLSRINAQLRTFVETFGVTDADDGRLEEATINFQEMSMQRLALEQAIQQARAGLASLEQPSEEMSSRELAQYDMMPRVQMLRNRLVMLREERQELTEARNYGPQHNMVRAVDQRIAEVQRTLDQTYLEARQGQLEGAQTNLDSLMAQYQELMPRLQQESQRMTDLESRTTRYRQLSAEADAARERVSRAQQSLAELRVASDHPLAERIIVQSWPDQAKLTFPQPHIVIGGTIVLMLGAVGGLVFLKELVDQRVSSPSDVQLLPDVSLLGMVPDTCEDPSGPCAVEGVVLREPTGLLAESYRQVRTAVLSKMDRRGYKTLVCVSAKPESGVSTLVHNLAGSITLNGRSVLIVDANFRMPVQAELNDVAHAPGLVDVLRDEAKLDDAIRTLDNGISVLPAGADATDSPPELLEGTAFRLLLGDLEAKYDFILIDAPPALLTSESRLLARHADALVVVVRAGRDQRGMVNRMLSQLDGQRADVLGVVLNRVRTSAGGYFRKSYEEFYKYQREGRLRSASMDRAPRDEPGLRRLTTEQSTNGSANGHAEPAAAPQPAAAAAADEDFDVFADASDAAPDDADGSDADLLLDDDTDNDRDAESPRA